MRKILFATLAAVLALPGTCKLISPGVAPSIPQNDAKIQKLNKEIAGLKAQLGQADIERTSQINKLNQEKIALEAAGTQKEQQNRYDLAGKYKNIEILTARLNDQAATSHPDANKIMGETLECNPWRDNAVRAKRNAIIGEILQLQEQETPEEQKRRQNIAAKAKQIEKLGTAPESNTEIKAQIAMKQLFIEYYQQAK
jgi:hypothetical protein